MAHCWSSSGGASASSVVQLCRPRASIDSSSQPLPPQVSVLWDLDNKPPKLSAFSAASQLRMTASMFGKLRETVALANRHAFNHVPPWIREQRQERKILDVLEKRGAIAPPVGAYPCALCGRKLKTNLDLKRHFKTIHTRERLKRMARLDQLKSKSRRDVYRKLIAPNEERYKAAARDTVTPKSGYYLAEDLRRAGVLVARVDDKPQAADEALRRRIQLACRDSRSNSGRGVVCLVSDDSDFKGVLRDARRGGLRTVVIGDFEGALGRNADAWLSWDLVVSGTARSAAAAAAMQWRAQDALARDLLHREEAGTLLHYIREDDERFSRGDLVSPDETAWDEDETDEEDDEEELVL